MNAHNHKRLILPVALCALLTASLPGSANAKRQPDPLVAALMSIGTTLIPIGLGAILWTQGRGTDEGYRYDLGLVFFGVGGILGPSSGKFYAGSDTDTWVTLGLRGATGTLALAGSAMWIRGDTAQTRNNGRALAGIGGGTTALLALYDIWSASSTALETQRKQGYGPGYSLIKPAPPSQSIVLYTELGKINRIGDAQPIKVSSVPSLKQISLTPLRLPQLLLPHPEGLPPTLLSQRSLSSAAPALRY